MSVDHPLGDQVVGELGQAPGRKRLAKIGRDRQRDPLDLLALRQRESARPAAPVTRIERVEAVPVEVVDHLADRVRVGEHDLGDPRPAASAAPPATRSAPAARSPPSPTPRRTIRSSRLPSSLLISRSSTRAAIVPSRPITGRERDFDSNTRGPFNRNRQTLPVRPLAQREQRARRMRPSPHARTHAWKQSELADARDQLAEKLARITGAASCSTASIRTMD